MVFFPEGRLTVKELHFLTSNALNDFKTCIFTLHSVEYLGKVDSESTFILLVANVFVNIIAHLCVNIYTSGRLGSKNKNEVASKTVCSMCITSSRIHLFFLFLFFLVVIFFSFLLFDLFPHIFLECFIFCIIKRDEIIAIH